MHKIAVYFAQEKYHVYATNITPLRLFMGGENLSAMRESYKTHKYSL
jgi:hypothetical protein